MDFNKQWDTRKTDQTLGMLKLNLSAVDCVARMNMNEPSASVFSYTLSALLLLIEGQSKRVNISIYCTVLYIVQ